MRATRQGRLLGAGGVMITVAIARETPLLIVLAAILLVLAGALVCLVWAVVFAKTDGPTTRFERVSAALIQFAVPTVTSRTDTELTGPRDSPDRRDGLG